VRPSTARFARARDEDRPFGPSRNFLTLSWREAPSRRAHDANAAFFTSWRLGVSIFLFFACLTPAFAANPAGDWYGEGYQPLWHENAQWKMHLGANGTYAIEFRQYRYCKLVLDQKETGTWTLNDEFRTVTTRVNGLMTRYENDYRVGTLTDKRFDITHIKTGQAYVEKRVGPDFKWPPPICPMS
jgi:hypothetical protein